MIDFKEAMRYARDRAGNKESAQRLKEILGIVKEHDARHGLTPEKAVAILQDLGPTFVKLGQIASTHPDVLPAEYCDAFGKLRADVAPLPASQIRASIEEELGRPIDELFSEFDDAPLGSASIAQVHRARIKDGGADVAVKVQRPGIVETVTRDLALMRRLLTLYEFLDPSEGQISFKQLVDELERTSKDELDFATEAGNLVRFYENNKDREHVTSPVCHQDYSTHAVLTMDYADGVRIDDIEKLELSDEQRESLGYLIADNYMDQILSDGFFHADPHAGNILVKEAGAGIEWIDFGMMGTLTQRDREAISSICTAVAKSDAYGLKRALMQIARPTGPIDHQELLSACERLLDQYANVDLESFNTAQLLDELLEGMRDEGFEFDPMVVMLARGLVTLEGTIHLVSPKINIMTVVTRYMRSNHDLKRFKRQAAHIAMDLGDSTRAAAVLPARVAETLEMLQKGQLRLDARMGMDKTFRDELSSSIGYFTMMLMAGCLFVGSCILCSTSMEPRVLEVPILGLAGFISGLVIAIYTFHCMHRDKKRRK